MQKLRVRPRLVDTSEATVTVVIPCYNYACYLPSAVHSALKQTGVRVDVVIVDDASTDDSLLVASRLSSENSRVQVVAHSTNAGPVQTFNDGLDKATGEFLVRLDADDLLTPGSLERAVAVARHYPSVGLIYGHPVHFSGENLPRARANPSSWTIWPGRQWLSDRCHSGYNVITSPEVVMRKSLVDRLGGQRPLDHTHDMEMWLRLAAFSDVAYIHGADQAWHREHPKSLSAQKVDAYRDLVERHLAFEVLFDGISQELPELLELQSAAKRAIAAQALKLATQVLDKNPADHVSINRFVNLAREIEPDVESVYEWQGLAARKHCGPILSSLHPLFVLQRIQRRVTNALRWQRWHRSGVF
ncbi:glycosyltransferase family 2 protein [Microvirga rosea]|nr:glycosyltransferase family 2 protein [Microvirga rosea]